ncbi:MAG: T9SS type A sorting domain-containing protein [Bacteroidetes bacterium]|nr:T9SS type A sorting domain-containing protein [Bacteroidota bacterium]
MNYNYFNLVSKGILSAFLILFASNLAYSQQFRPQSAKDIPPPHEVAEGDYQYIPRSSMPKSPAYKFSIPGFFMVQVNVDEEGNNIVGDAANEPSIAVDPNDPNKMAIGWRQFATVNNNFRQAGYGYSADGGQTWTFPEVIDPGVFRSDPVLVSDSEGNFFYNSLTVEFDEYSCDVYKSIDGGATWDAGTYAYGGDKQWMTVDNSESIGSGNLYAFWTSSYSICEPDFFTRSTDSGLSWEYCISVNGNPYWGTLTTDSQGNLYVAGMQWNGFVVVKSSNAKDPEADIWWDFDIPVDLDGSLVGFGGYDCPNPSGLLGQTIIDADRSGGQYDGNIYILASVERNSNADPCDVMFTRSTNGGLSWSTPIRINDDPSNQAYQWFGTMSVAPNGRIDAVWLDTREVLGDVWSSLYYCYSEDGGLTWVENIKLSESFNPHLGWPQQDKMGDYFDMISDENGAHLAWAGTFNGEQDVYYAYISMETTGIAQNQSATSMILEQNYPNPFKGETQIQYVLHQSGPVSLHITDLQGRVVANLVNEVQVAGQYQVLFNASDLPDGVYYYTLVTNAGRNTKKMIVLK